jgi:putative membrane protein
MAGVAYDLVYCGAPAIPGALAGRFNLDPVLIAALAAITVLHLAQNRRAGRAVGGAAAGWAIAAAALISPLCALSVSLFAARVAQHMILLLAAAPLIAASLPRWRTIERPVFLWSATIAFFALLWFWHMPTPYEATFRSHVTYWLMHASLAGSGVALWAALLRQHSAQALAAGVVTSIQMGLLGAIICLASWPMYRPHYATTESWGLTPLADQQMGGVIMWVPGCLIFLWIAVRTVSAMWRALEEAPV